MEPEVVVGREHRDPEGDQGSPADQQRPRTTRRNRPEELALVELGPSHRAILAGHRGRRTVARRAAGREEELRLPNAVSSR